MEPYLLHPAAVHFPIALLSTGLVAAYLAERPRASPWLAEAASWLLWAGTVSAWAALGLGLLAEKTAPHVPSAWETLEDHETLAWWTTGLFTALSLWRVRLRCGDTGRGARLAFLAGWLAACGLLAATGFHGGELVFRHGMGVRGR